VLFVGSLGGLGGVCARSQQKDNLGCVRSLIEGVAGGSRWGGLGFVVSFQVVGGGAKKKRKTPF